MNITPLIKTFFILLAFAMPARIQAQMPKAGTYVQQPALAGLEGTWTATKGVETLTIIFKLQLKQQFGKLYTDAVIGWHEYKVNGITESSTLINLNNEQKINMAIVSFYPIDLKAGAFCSFTDPLEKWETVALKSKW